MRSESDRIHEILKNDAGVIALVDVDNIFPLIAHHKVKLPFINYHVSEEPTYSKEGKIEIIVNIDSFAETYNEVAAIADVVKAAFEKPAIPEQFFYLTGTPSYNEEKLISVNQNFKYKEQ